ncbi:hypothetical protein ACFX13_014336 [Malus domestica]
MEYINSRKIVHFHSLEKPKEEDFILELSKLDTYDDVVKKVICQIGLEYPTIIRLTAHCWYSQQPNPQPINYRGVKYLQEMLIPHDQGSDILYYEVLDIPLPEMQALKIHSIRLPKWSTVGDVINELQRKVRLSHPNAELRLLEVFKHRIYKTIPCNEKVEKINNQFWTLRAEEISEEEKNLGVCDRLIQVYHFAKGERNSGLYDRLIHPKNLTKEIAQKNQMQVKNFGEPFFLVIHEGETLTEVKVCVQRKLQVPDEEFSKRKFALLSRGCPKYLQDSDIVWSRLQRRDAYGARQQYLGLEHSDNAPKRASAVTLTGNFCFTSITEVLLCCLSRHSQSPRTAEDVVEKVSRIVKLSLLPNQPLVLTIHLYVVK